MKKLTAPVLLVTGAVAALLAGCEADSPQTPEARAAQAGLAEATGSAGPEVPPVAGDSAFTWTPEDAGLQWGDCPPFMPESCRLAVVQGDPQAPNADVFFRMAPGTTVPEHWHTSAERMVLLSGVMEVDYEGQAPVRMEPGTYAYGPSKLPHETHCLGTEGDDDCVLFIAFEEPVDAVEGTPDEVPHDHEAFVHTPDDPEVPWGQCPDFMPEGCELAVIQDLDAEGYNADAFFKLAPDTRVPMHWHTSAERMVLVSGEMRVNYQGQRPVELAPLAYAYGPPELPHETRCGSGDECVLFIAFEEPVDATEAGGGDLPHRR